MAFLDRGDGVALAYRVTPGRTPGVVFLPGFMSDMTGEKAQSVEAYCRDSGQACLLLDYSGHGASGGRFEDGTIGQWVEDALHVIDHACPTGELVVIGSSMGGWIALHVALARAARMAGLIGIAAAPDFTEELMMAAMTPAERDTLLRDGVLRVPSAYGGEQIITRRLIEEGRDRLLLQGEKIDIPCPVRLLHGMDDPDVPWETALKLAWGIAGGDVQVTLVKDAGHRLSRPEDIALLLRTLGGLLNRAG